MRVPVVKSSIHVNIKYPRKGSSPWNRGSHHEEGWADWKNADRQKVVMEMEVEMEVAMEVEVEVETGKKWK